MAKSRGDYPCSLLPPRSLSPSTYGSGLNFHIHGTDEGDREYHLVPQPQPSISPEKGRANDHGCGGVPRPVIGAGWDLSDCVNEFLGGGGD